MKLVIVKDRLFQQSVLRVNYTTYDMCRDQDTINPRTHADIMILSGNVSEEQTHPYWYARVVGIYQATVKYSDPGSPKHGLYQMDFLFVRWFGDDPEHRSGSKAKWLHRIGFVEQEDEAAFDPPAKSNGGTSPAPAITKYKHGKEKRPEVIDGKGRENRE